MNEQELADKFSEELDMMLDSGQIDDPQSQFSQDLAFAKILADADLSLESAIHDSLAADLEDGPETSIAFVPILKTAAAFSFMLMIGYGGLETWLPKEKSIGKITAAYNTRDKSGPAGTGVGRRSKSYAGDRSSSAASQSYRDPSVSMGDLRNLARRRLAMSAKRQAPSPKLKPRNLTRSQAIPGFRGGAGGRKGLATISVTGNASSIALTEVGTSRATHGYGSRVLPAFTNKSRPVLLAARAADTTGKTTVRVNGLVYSAVQLDSLPASESTDDGSRSLMAEPPAKTLAAEVPDQQSWRNAEAAPVDREGYDNLPENPFLLAKENPLSTFSIDVDGASYSNVRRIINEGRLPPAGAVRIEEMINYFKYDYPQPTGKHPFSITTELAASPWNPKHKLVHIGLKGKEIAKDNLPPSNLVFLIDTSGSMHGDIELVKKSLALLVNELREEDRISIVAYAGSAGLVLPGTSGIYKDRILSAIANLNAGGSTAGGAGINLAYKVANENFRKGGNNRVILATDGDFNVGLSSDSELITMIEKKRAQGVFLTVLGFGRGNYQDAKMEKLANKGNGNYAYIDTLKEANKVLVSEMGGTLLTIAKDVKIQVEFNPARVQAYRLVGYENRMLRAQDFNDDKKDAGELGSGHTVTALYEIIPAGIDSDSTPKKIDALKYQAANAKNVKSKELLTVKFRYKKPDEKKSQLLTRPLLDQKSSAPSGTQNLRFSAAVAQFAMLLRKSESAKNLSYEGVLEQARAAKGKDPHGYRAQFLRLVEKARNLDKRND